MNGPGAYPTIFLPRPHATRAAVALGYIWRALIGAAGALRRATRTPEGNALERETLEGLSEHMLKDIGAQAWLVANAATRARDAIRTNSDAWRY